MNKEEIKRKIEVLECDMTSATFWNNPKEAQNKIKELQILKAELEGGSAYDSGGAIVNIFSGVGGDDAEDFTRILLEMYTRYAGIKNWAVALLDENQNPNGGYRSVTFEIAGKNVYKNLRHESGVHRLVRISPFNAAGKRQTSFSMVEVLPILDTKDFVVDESEFEIEFTKGSGPGGQNVNKRETAVRVTHRTTGVSVCASAERTQHANKTKAMEIIQAKLFKIKKAQEEKNIADYSISKVQDITWGNQIRSYVIHPYKMIKDHRSNYETSQVDKVLAGEIDDIIQSVQQLDSN